MDQELNTVQQDVEAEDSLPEEITEEPAEEAISLEEVDQDESKPEEKQPQSAGGQKEPGYVRTRINEAVASATRQLQDELAALRAQLEPLKEYQITAEAQELVRSGKVKDLETAKELVRYRSGAPAQPKAAEQPRNEQGQFAPKQNPAIDARSDLLARQAIKIKEKRGLDVIAEYNKNEETRAKVLSGEWDFYDVADDLAQRKANKPKAPSPMRSPNGASGQTPNAIESMTDEQFARMEKRIKEGARIRLR